MLPTGEPSFYDGYYICKSVLMNSVVPVFVYMGVSQKRGEKPKMDGENNGSNPMNKWMIWGVFRYFWVDTHIDRLRWEHLLFQGPFGKPPFGKRPVSFCPTFEVGLFLDDAHIIFASLSQYPTFEMFVGD